MQLPIAAPKFFLNNATQFEKSFKNKSFGILKPWDNVLEFLFSKYLPTLIVVLQS